MRQSRIRLIKFLSSCRLMPPWPLSTTREEEIQGGTCSAAQVACPKTDRIPPARCPGRLPGEVGWPQSGRPAVHHMTQQPLSSHKSGPRVDALQFTTRHSSHCLHTSAHCCTALCGIATHGHPKAVVNDMQKHVYLHAHSAPAHEAAAL